MNIHQSIELFVAINLGVVGLSHLLQPRIWVEFFQYLYSKKHAGNIFNAILALAVGSFVFSLHFIWKWPAVLVTIYGLIQGIKGVIYLIIPAIGISMIGNVTMEKANKFRSAGMVMIIFSGVIIYWLVTGKTE